MAFNVSYVFQAIDNFSAVARQIENRMTGITEKARNATQSLSDMGSKLAMTGGKFSLALTAPLALIGKTALGVSSEFEMMGVSFETMLGSADKAKSVINDIIKFSAKTPFGLREVEKAALRLITAGVSVEKLTDQMELLGNIASGTNVPITDMAQIFMKAKGKGRLMTEEIMQLAERGIPILQVLAKGFKTTEGNILKAASEGKISFEIFQKALEKMGGEGGMFANLMDKQSKTFGGALANMQDNITIFLKTLGDFAVQNLGLTEIINDFTDKIVILSKSIKEFATNNPKLAKFILISIGIAAALGPVMVALGFAIQGLAGFGKALLFLTSPIGLIIAAIVATAATLLYLYNKFEIIRNIIDFVIGGIIKFVNTFPLISAAIAIVIGGLLAFGKGVILLQGIMALARIAIIAFNLVCALNPYILIGAAIAAMVAGIIYFGNKLGWFTSAFQTIKEWADIVANAFRNMFDFDFSGKIDSLKSAVSDITSSVKDKITGLFSFEASELPPLPTVPPIPNTISPLIDSNLNLGAQTIRTESQSTVDINLKGNTQSIENIRSKTDGKTNLAISQNMAYGGY